LDTSTCRTFSDASNANTCLENVHAAASTASRQLIVSTCSACGGTQCDEGVATAEAFPYLTDDDVATVPSCRGQACDFASIAAACAPVLPDLRHFTTCQ
jgi:hypothetical protein